MKKIFLITTLLLISTNLVFAHHPLVLTAEEDGDPDDLACYKIKFANANLTDNGDGTCSVADQTGAGSGDNVTVDGTAIDTTANFKDNTEIVFTEADGGAGGPDDITADIVNDTLDFTEFSNSMSLDENTDITLGALNLNFKVNSTGLMEVDGQGAFAGDLLHVHQHVGNPTGGNLIHAEAEDADISPLIHIESLAVDTTVSDVVSLLIDTDVDDDTDFIPLEIRDDNALNNDLLFQIDSSGTVQTGIWNAGAVTSSGTIEGATLTEGGNAVPNATDHLGFFGGTTSAQFLDEISDETGSTKVVGSDSPTFTTELTATDLIDVEDMKHEDHGEVTYASGSAVIEDSITVDGWVLGNSTATTINKVTITAPATASTLTIADGKTLTATNTVNINTLTDERICNYEATGTELNCDIALSGADATIITGTATSGQCAEFNGDGDIVGSGAACGGGATAWDDIGNPDNNGAKTITFDNNESSILTGNNDAAVSFFTIQNSDADHTAGQMYLLDLDYSADDGDAEADFIKFQDSGSIVASIQQNGEFATDGGVTAGGTVEGATITEGGTGVPNLNETDWVAAAEMADADHGDVAWSGGDAEVQSFTVVDSTYAADFVVLTNTNAGADAPIKADGALTYDATTGTLAATQFSGGGASITGIEGTQIKSTGEGGGTKYLREDGDGTSSWQAVAGGFTSFHLEDGDGTEVEITDAKEVKFIESTGLDINWTDVDNGTDADPYDMTFTIAPDSIVGAISAGALADDSVVNDDIDDDGAFTFTGAWSLSDLTLAGILKDNDDMVFECDANSDGSNKFSFTDGASTEKAYIDESGNIQLDGDLYVDGGQIGLTGDTDLITVAANTVTVAGSVNISTALDVQGGDITLQNDETISNATDGMYTFAGIIADNDDVVIEIDANSDGSNKLSVTDGAAGEVFSVTEAGVAYATGNVTSATGFDCPGDVDCDYGNATTDDHTFQTDGTGTAEIVLPAGSIDGTEILDDAVDSDDYNADSIDNEHVNWADIDYLDDEGAIDVAAYAAVGTFASGDTFVCLEAGVGVRECDYDDLPAGGGNPITEVVLPVQSAKLSGTCAVKGDATQGAAIDGGDSNWRLLFDATTDEGACWFFRMPDNYSSAPILRVGFSMTSGEANEVQFEGAIGCLTLSTDTTDVGSDFMAAIAEGTATTVSATAGEGYLQSITLTDDSCAAGDFVTIYLSTDADDGTNDDATGDREVVYVSLAYTGS